MKANESFVVYELNAVMGSERHLALEEVVFDGYVPNNFESEHDAIEALLKDEKTYREYFILKKVYITN